MKSLLKLFVFLFVISTVQSQNYEKLWTKVENFELEEKTEDAKKVSKKIYAYAKKKDNSRELIKSFIYLSKFSQILDENSALKFSKNIEKEINESDGITKAFFHLIYAKFLKDYYNKYSYEIRKRLATNQPKNIEYATESELINFINENLFEAIKAKELLKSTALESYKTILKGSQNSLKYRTTLYEYFIYETLSLIQKHRDDKYELSEQFSASELYASPSKFINLQIQENHKSQKIQKLKWLQGIEEFHIKNGNKIQLMDAVISRFKILQAMNYSYHNNQLLEVISYLKKIIEDYENEEAVNILKFHLASTYYDNSNYKEVITGKRTFKQKAHDLCEQIISTYPKSEAAISAELLLKTIESKLLDIKLETTGSPQKPALARVNYTNVDSIYVTVYKIPFNTFQNNNRTQNDSIVKKIIVKQPRFQFTQNLPVRDKYYSQSAEILIPKLDMGHYLVVASITKQFNLKDVITYQTTTRSNLHVSQFSEKDYNTFEISHRETGLPIADASLNLNLEYNNYAIDIKSNQSGLAKVQKLDRSYNNLSGYVTKSTDTLFLDRIDISSYNTDKEWIAYTKLILDRNIYRPGQTLYFKGYLYEKKNGDDKVVPNTYCSIIIYDSNGDELKEFRLKTNEFGTVSGEFKLPKKIKTGEFSIEMDEDYDEDNDEDTYWDIVDDFEYVEKTFYVEEYKRPKFEVLVNPITQNYKLGDTVRISGKASSFFGQSLSNSKVKYAIKSGSKGKPYSKETRTDANGNFTVDFPSEETIYANKRKLTYTLTVDVTDRNGETQSVKTNFNLGNYNLNISTNASGLITDDDSEITIYSRNLNDGFTPSMAKVKIHKIDYEESILNRSWVIPQHQTIDSSTFAKYFKFYRYKAKNQNKYYNETLVYESEMNITDKAQLDLANICKQNGRYSIDIKAFTKDKDTSETKRSFTYQSKTLKREAPTALFEYESVNLDIVNNGKISLRLTPAIHNTNFKINVLDEKNNLYSRNITVYKDTIASISLPKSMVGKADVSIHALRQNHFYSKHFELEITPKNQDLIIETLRFRNQIEPKKEEQWTFKIKNLDGTSEVVASMYDESLDDFFKDENVYFDDGLDWTSLSFENYYSYNDFDISEKERRYPALSFRTSNPFYYKTIKRNYLKLNYFGLDFRNQTYQSKKYLKELLDKKITKHQNLGNISGIVVAASDGLPLPGVNVIIKGTARGTQTDFDGFYSINAKEGEQLVFSFVSMKTTEAKIDKNKSINIMMDDDVAALDEVVISGYATTTKKSSSVASVSVSSMRVENRPNAGFVQVLSGQMPGVNITSSTGQPGGNSLVQLRGVSSVHGNTEPLFIVDGVPVDASTFKILNTNDIASVNVLKDAGATAIYGSRGANGVIIVNTKYGSSIAENGKTITVLSEKDIAKIETRTDFNETAFFFPHLRTDKDNTVSFTFNAPEMLTRWKFQLISHNKNAQSGITKLNAVTKKDLIVTPNIPRFLREGDSITISSKIDNLSSKLINGDAIFQIYDAKTNSIINTFKIQPFTTDQKETTSVSWKFEVPEGYENIGYKLIAKTKTFSDGEEGIIPVLKKKILVTETLPIMVNTEEEKSYRFDKLLNNNSSTLNHKKLEINISVSTEIDVLNALPYLNNFEFNCAEQLFSKYYAVRLGEHLLSSHPQLKAYVSSKTDTLNQVKFLLDKDSINDRINTITPKIKALQKSNGGFAWFNSEGKVNTFITQHILSSYAHLIKIGAEDSQNSPFKQNISKALSFIDAEYIKRGQKKSTTQSIDLHYLYTRSYFLETHPISEDLKKIIDEKIEPLKKDWIKRSLYEKALITMTMHRLNHKKEAQKIIESLRQTSVYNSEFGRYWKENTNSTYWANAQIETQAAIIEAFTEIEKNDTKTIREISTWLLTKKQSQSWKTTKATTEAIYALLLNQGKSNQNRKTKTVTLNIGDTITKEFINNLKESNISVGGKDVTNNLGKIEISNKKESPIYGSVEWQYFEDLDKITPAETPLKLNKKLFLKTNTDRGEEITEITKKTKLNVGDLVKVRIELRSDRDMEFLHLKDMRAAGFEPINVLSQYKWQDGLSYYESTKDAATNFFIDYLPKGVYVFEYDLRVNNSGDMSNGITTIQSMYAPEFSSHSEGIRVKVN